MKIIDTHVHVWTHEPAFPWAKEAIAPPPYNAHPKDLLHLMGTNGIVKTALVQYIDYRWDNSYVAHVLRAFPDKFMGVCRVDPEKPSAPEDLSYWTKVYNFHGVRLSPREDKSGDWFTRPSIIPLFRRAAELGVPVLILTKPSRLPDLANILECVPNVDVVIDHMADCIDGDAHHLQNLLALARYSRVFLKLSHLWVNSSCVYPWHDTHTRIKQVCDVFGARRIMWGSDWPFCLKHASYSQTLSFLQDASDVFSQEDLSWILGETALQLWPFSI